MTPLRKAAGQTFQALQVRNYRIYFTGQAISVSGTWMQSIALGLLILYPLHGTGVEVGVSTALQFVPMLLFGSWGGLIADRLNKRTLLFATQGAAGVLALALGLLTGLHAETLAEVYVLASLLGVVNLFDNPARQAFVSEMVGMELLPNAVSLNSALMNSARVIGPAIGSVLISTVGSGAHTTAHATIGYPICFLVNATSYVAVIIALVRIRPADLYRGPRVARAKGQVRAGLRYVWSTSTLRDPLLAMTVVGIFAFNFTTTLPLLAKFTFHGGPGTYGAFTVAMASGAVLGGLVVAHRSRPSSAMLSIIGLAFGVMILLVAAAPTKVLTLAALFLMGICSLSFIATANATLQLAVDPSMRGRVMALYATAFLGTTPFGAPLVGWISDVSSPRIALLVGGVTTIGASVPLAIRYLRRPAVMQPPAGDANVVGATGRV